MFLNQETYIKMSEADLKKFGLRDNENLYIGIKPN